MYASQPPRPSMPLRERTKYRWVDNPLSTPKTCAGCGNSTDAIICEAVTELADEGGRKVYWYCCAACFQSDLDYYGDRAVAGRLLEVLAANCRDAIVIGYVKLKEEA